MKIYLHIGAGKCASSSIQQYFCHNNEMGDFTFGLLNQDGSISTGAEVQQRANLAPSGYAVSYGFADHITTSFTHNLTESLKDISQKYSTLLMSYEGWSIRDSEFADLRDAFSEHEVSVLFVVRPPAQWMNSAWWQWQQWTGDNIDSWVEHKNVAKEWVGCLHRWMKVDYVRAVNVLTLSSTIIADVSAIIGICCEPNRSLKHNKASSQELLNFLIEKRSLRKGPYAPNTEFILNKYVESKTKANWVLSKKNIELILDSTRESCLELAKYISNADITEHQCWWEASYYEHLPIGQPRGERLTREELSSMLEEAYHIIIELDGQLKGKVIRAGLRKEEIDLIRDVAVRIENNDLQSSQKLMRLAGIYRPKGKFILNKINEYEVAFANNNLSFVKRLAKRLRHFFSPKLSVE